ncbi:MAG: UxaA family hydrolase, partial [Alphaproteobacteria bacterium]
MSAKTAIQLSEGDNVAVVLTDVDKGDMVAPVSITAREPIPRGHKIATAPIREGDAVLKYGQIIGFASAHIAPGEHVHVHNVSMGEFERDYAYGEGANETVMVPEADRATFQGFRREDGRVGTRNYVGIVSSVNCSATASRMIAREIEKRGILDDYPNIDGIVPIVHGAGCCIGTDDEAFRMLHRTIWGHARHANFASVLMLGLGCETLQIPLMLDVMGKPSEETFHSMTMQDEGGTRKTVEEAVEWFE